MEKKELLTKQQDAMQKILKPYTKSILKNGLLHASMDDIVTHSKEYFRKEMERWNREKKRALDRDTMLKCWADLKTKKHLLQKPREFQTELETMVDKSTVNAVMRNCLSMDGKSIEMMKVLVVLGLLSDFQLRGCIQNILKALEQDGKIVGAILRMCLDVLEEWTTPIQDPTDVSLIHNLLDYLDSHEGIIEVQDLEKHLEL